MKFIVNLLVKISYYPRFVLDSVLFLYLNRHNNWSLLTKFANKDCLIVGNGPSLRKTPLEKIKMMSIGMNKINLIFTKTSWRPDAIVCVNGLVLRQNRDFFNNTDIPLIVPVKGFYIGIKNRSNVIYVKRLNTKDFNSNIMQGVGIGSTVTYTCMQVAAFANVKSINIVGVDHSFNFSGKNKISLHKGEDQNHFDPNYFKDKLWGLPDLEGSERAYLKAKSYFESKNINAIDYTIDGKLKVFKKRDIEEIIT